MKVFLSLLRKRKKRSGKHCGILFKCTPENRLELLRRVKTVFDSGDAESRALALVLFGCWNEMAKDNADIRYLILSSLVSGDVLQVSFNFGVSSKFPVFMLSLIYFEFDVIFNMACVSERWQILLVATLSNYHA